jgi:hypothetical protein
MNSSINHNDNPISINGIRPAERQINPIKAALEPMRISIKPMPTISSKMINPIPIRKFVCLAYLRKSRFTITLTVDVP